MNRKTITCSSDKVGQVAVIPARHSLGVSNCVDFHRIGVSGTDVKLVFVSDIVLQTSGTEAGVLVAAVDDSLSLFRALEQNTIPVSSYDQIRCGFIKDGWGIDE
ncbi:hypothetical protein OXX59_005559 [Metschnikowia pulcherrima]